MMDVLNVSPEGLCSPGRQSPHVSNQLFFPVGWGQLGFNIPPAPPSVLLPVLQAKAKRGPPRQAKYAIHCIHAMFVSRDTHFAQIFEVSPPHCSAFVLL